ncbi:aegerolysin family protein (plasmid) [Rhizobium ruizarguesonis]|uniref:Aegerolysin family protein n=1 Tax=Rhizobium ruizarguesonis TaxID=2081791 RepID=A0ACD5EH05_9HYPH
MSDAIAGKEPRGPIERSARSAVIQLHNQTSAILQLQQDTLTLEHGEWVIYPPANIYPGQIGSWQTDSNGFMTGTEGRCTYQFIAGSTIANVKLHWDNPYVGGNSYSIGVTPPPYSGDYSGGSGDNSTVTYKVYRIA